MLVGVVDCTAFACYSVVQGEAVHGEVVCVASPVLEDNPALDRLVDTTADGALVHLTHLAGGLAIRQEAVPYFSPILSCFRSGFDCFPLRYLAINAQKILPGI